MQQHRRHDRHGPPWSPPCVWPPASVPPRLCWPCSSALSSAASSPWWAWAPTPLPTASWSRWASPPSASGVCVLGTLYFTFVGRKFIPDTGYVPEFAQTDRKPLDKRKAVIAVVTLLCVLVVHRRQPGQHPHACGGPWWAPWSLWAPSA